jgi:hypothetical protein
MRISDAPRAPRRPLTVGVCLTVIGQSAKLALQPLENRQLYPTRACPLNRPPRDSLIPRGPRGRITQPRETPPKLSDLGVTKFQACQWQRLARLDEKSFEEKVARTTAKAVPSLPEKADPDRQDSPSAAARSRDDRCCRSHGNHRRVGQDRVNRRRAGRTAQYWELTVGQPGKEETRWLHA